MKDVQSLAKISFFSNIFTFLSIICQNFEYNLRILANFGIKAQNLRISPIPFQKTAVFFLDSLIKIILFALKIYLLQRKMPKVSLKSNFLVTFLHF